MWQLAVLTIILLIAADAATGWKFLKTLLDSEEPGQKGGKPRRKNLMSEREQAMLEKLKEALPAHNIFAQVSMGALLNAKSRGMRNTFDRKIADFVICDRACEVVAIIELDDRSHDNKKDKDEERDRMLINAGYKVVRYAQIPEIEKIKEDINGRAPLVRVLDI